MNPIFVCLLVYVVCVVFVDCVDFSARRNSAGAKPRSTNGLGGNNGDGDDFYQILGVERSCSARDIKAAYRKKAMSMHPDKGGDAEEFKKLVEAYETLSDESKRKVYDRFGKSGANIPGFRQGSDDADPFRDIFRGFGGFGFQMPTVYNLELSLEDIFAGREILVNMGKNQVTVRITPGMLDGTELGADVAGRQVIFVLQERPHPVFTRKKHDLLMSIKVTLIDSLLGFEKKIGLLDGSEVTVTTAPGRITAKDDVLVLEGLGMPIPDDPLRKRGDLFVHVEVETPQNIQFSAEDRAVLQRIFGPASPRTILSDTSATSAATKRYVMKPSHIRQFGRRKGTNQGNNPNYFSNYREFGDDDNDDGFSSFSSFFFR